MTQNLLKTLPRLSQIEAELCKRDFYYFVKKAFPISFPGETFQDNWHIQAICNYVEKMVKGDVQNLIVNIPPRHMKSVIFNVMLPCWRLAINPSEKFIFVTHSQDLITRDSNKCRDLIQSPWYQERFPDVKLVKSTEAQFTTSKGGYRMGFGMAGGVTGTGANWVVVDDPIKAGDSKSDATKNTANYIYDNAIFNRVNDVQKDKRIVVMQRLAQDDLTGHLLDSDLPFEHLCLPLIYEGVRFTSSFGFVDPRKDGELLWEERFPRKEMEDIRKALGERDFAGQYQQRPGAVAGNIFKKEWFETRESPTNFIARFISFDTAATSKENSAYSAAIVGELLPDYRLFIRHVWRDKVDFPQLQQKVEELIKRWGYDLHSIVIENKSSGISLVQTLEQSLDSETAEKLVAFNPPASLNKEGRAELASLWCEKGCVVFPPPSEEFEWLFDFEEEIFLAPNSRYMDMTDAFGQLILYLEHYLSEGFKARKG